MACTLMQIDERCDSIGSVSHLSQSQSLSWRDLSYRASARTQAAGILVIYFPFPSRDYKGLIPLH